jgi:hypothetical protein
MKIHSLRSAFTPKTWLAPTAEQTITLLCRRCGKPFLTDQIRQLCPPCALAAPKPQKPANIGSAPKIRSDQGLDNKFTARAPKNSPICA